SPLHAELHRKSAVLTEEFRSLAVGLGEIWLEKVLFATQRPVTLGETLGTETPMADLVRAIDRLDFEPTALMELVPEIGVLQSKLPPELQHESGLISVSPTDMSTLCEDIKEMLIARLLGQEGGE
ncbi:MAG: DNA repair exonuclease, partial [Proteobacteria bacterium]|nr:DNA repair exonuclease [Pseudomonadota bacterium]